MFNNVLRHLPPFMPPKFVRRDEPEYETMPLYTSFFVPGNGLLGLAELPFVLERHLGNIMGEELGKSTSAVPFFEPQLQNSDAGNGTKLDLAALKEAARSIIGAVSRDYVEGVQTMYLIHPAVLRETIVQVLSKLPLAPSAYSGDRRLLWVPGDKESHAFQVEPYEIELPARHVDGPGWLIVYLFNPDDPALEMRIPAPGPWTNLEPTLAFGNTSDIESAAMAIIEEDLQNKGVMIDFTPEPYGKGTFPDFEADIEGTKWTIEMTRVLDGVAEGRVFRMGGKNQESRLARVAQSPPLGSTEVEEALISALEGKAAKASQRKQGSKYCLVLVNVVAFDIGRQSTVWNGKDLSAFDAVIVIHTNATPGPTLEYIKGELIVRLGSAA